MGEPVTGVIRDIVPVVEGGNTRYYFRFEGADIVYIADISLSSRLPFLHAGDEITVSCAGDGSPLQVVRFE